MENRTSISCPDAIATPHDVQVLLKSLPNSSSDTPDGLYARFLKEVSFAISTPLAAIISKSLKTGVFPAPWSEAYVSPILKKPPTCKPSNYRPISKTCWTGKIAEHIMKNAIMPHILSNDLIDKSQFGFIPGRSTTSQLLVASWRWSRWINEKEAVEVFYSDCEKAFDLVDHRKLLHILPTFGINGQNLNWIKSFLLHRHQRVLVENTLSTTGDVTSGVVQGSVLGPVLFVIYLNSAASPQVVRPPCAVDFYADDAKFSAPSSRK
jgi:hypothetical protein